MEKNKKIKTQVAGMIGGLVGFFGVRYLGIVPFVPFTLIVITLGVLTGLYNKGNKNKILGWQHLSASILIGHGIWVLIGNLLLLAQGAGISLITIIGGIGVITYFTIAGLGLKFNQSKKPLIAGITASFVFTLMNLSSLTSIGNQAYAPLILLHSFFRLAYIACAIWTMWLMDTQKSESDEVMAQGGESFSA